MGNGVMEYWGGAGAKQTRDNRKYRTRRARRSQCRYLANVRSKGRSRLVRYGISKDKEWDDTEVIPPVRPDAWRDELRLVPLFALYHSKKIFPPLRRA